jgi:hypothetical protein
VVLILILINVVADFEVVIAFKVFDGHSNIKWSIFSMYQYFIWQGNKINIAAIQFGD